MSAVMFVRTIDDLEALDQIRFPADESFRSARFLIAADGLGFSCNENLVRKGTTLAVWLKHHWEANYIISGKGEVTDLTSQETWTLEAGILYVVGPNDRHRLHFTEDECHLSIFFPPLTGSERFDSDGAYEPSGPIAKTNRRIFVRSADGMRRDGEEVISGNGQVRTIPMLTGDDGIGFGVSLVRIPAGAEYGLPDNALRQTSHVISPGPAS